MQSQLRSIKVGGMELAYVERGSGGAVVFVHGGFSDYRSWESQVREFSNKYRAISYSLRYHYPNQWGDGTDYNLQIHTKDLASLIEQLEASPAHIVGTSYGAESLYTSHVIGPGLSGLSSSLSPLSAPGFNKFQVVPLSLLKFRRITSTLRRRQ